MSEPLLNDFGVPISRDKARAALEAAGWFQSEGWGDGPCGNWCRPNGVGTADGPWTLREAWEEHKARGKHA